MWTCRRRSGARRCDSGGHQFGNGIFEFFTNGTTGRPALGSMSTPTTREVLRVYDSNRRGSKSRGAVLADIQILPELFPRDVSDKLFDEPSRLYVHFVYDFF